MMQRVSEVMTRDVRFLSPQESLQRAAQMMDELNVGAIPICENERLVGMITDRDITVRATAAGKTPQAHIEEAMSGDVRWCFEDQSLDDVMRQMADTQIRRVPVVSHDEQHRLVGIVALGDLATRMSGGSQREDVENVVEQVSSPSWPDRSGANGKGAPAGASAGTTASGGSPAAGAGAAGGTGLGSAASAGNLREPASAGVGGEGGTPRAATGPGGAGGAAGAGGIGGRGAQDDAKQVSKQASRQAPQAGNTAAVVGAGGGTAASAGARNAGTAGSIEHARDNTAPGAGPATAPDGIDAAAPGGASGGISGGTAGGGSAAGRKR
jgi:CBS domain-containing protein